MGEFVTVREKGDDHFGNKRCVNLSPHFPKVVGNQFSMPESDCVRKAQGVGLGGGGGGRHSSRNKGRADATRKARRKIRRGINVEGGERTGPTRDAGEVEVGVLKPSLCCGVAFLIVPRKKGRKKRGSSTRGGAH